jgi:hypothetical protein
MTQTQFEPLAFHNSWSVITPIPCPVPDWETNPLREVTDDENQAINDWYVALNKRKPDSERLGSAPVSTREMLDRLAEAGKEIFPTQQDFDDYVSEIELVRKNQRVLAR